jgi:hypothetical protein
MIVIPTKQIPHDPTLRRWHGRYFLPHIGEHYSIPENAGNHPECRGRSGICIETLQTEFGMYWGVIKFFEPKEDDGVYEYPDISTVRSKYLILCPLIIK